MIGRWPRGAGTSRGGGPARRTPRRAARRRGRGDRASPTVDGTRSAPVRPRSEDPIDRQSLAGRPGRHRAREICWPSRLMARTLLRRPRRARRLPAVPARRPVRRIRYLRDLGAAVPAPAPLRARAACRAGELRLWNPLVHEGIPLSPPAVGYPLDVLQLLRPDDAGISLALCLHVPLAALAFHAMARGLGPSPRGGGAGARWSTPSGLPPLDRQPLRVRAGSGVGTASSSSASRPSRAGRPEGPRARRRRAGARPLDHRRRGGGAGGGDRPRPRLAAALRPARRPPPGRDRDGAGARRGDGGARPRARPASQIEAAPAAGGCQPRSSLAHLRSTSSPSCRWSSERPLRHPRKPRERVVGAQLLPEGLPLRPEPLPRPRRPRPGRGRRRFRAGG
ncbi:MAG: hypothetical protein M0C28_28065 [Candidatus Moduliflexus flocculans]|nr:hypothetical protein [Candidatus Moduliflexus flocculans]